MKSLFGWLKKYFIPHGKNDYKPHFLRYESTLFVLLIVIVIEISFLTQVFVIFDKTNFLASVLPGVLTTLTNEERSQNDAGPLKENDLLTKAAQLKAQDMANNGYFAHTSPDGKTPWYWLDQVGYHYAMAGENLAVNFFESKDVAEAWMNSPTHRANIVKKNYTEIGIGVATGVYEGSSTVFVAQFFGTPIAIQSTPTQLTTTTPVKPATKATTTPTKKPPVTTPKVTPTPAPKPIPKTVAVAPTTVQVLGEETNSVSVKEEIGTFTNIKLFFEKILTSPSEYVTVLFVGIIMLIILTLLLGIFIKIEKQHPIMITRGLAVVAVIIVIIVINMKILTTQTKVPAEGLSANVIAY